MLGAEIVRVLQERYPDKATELKGKSEVDREVYLAQLDMIEEIKALLKDGK